ncbi:hypothetical protein BGZ83_007143 [Gryganskiella cystojenkinii]|nr:hypothetical protein BGZ83_007143 [Gryganskiella cystojenkinii]
MLFKRTTAEPVALDIAMDNKGGKSIKRLVLNAHSKMQRPPTILSFHKEQDLLKGQRLHQLFESKAQSHANATAIVSSERTLTYRELDAWANILARQLRYRGVTAGHRIGVMLQRSAFTYQALLGVLKVGAVLVPIDGGTPPDRVTYIAQNADLALLLTCASTHERASAARCPVMQLDGDNGPESNLKDEVLTPTQPPLELQDQDREDAPCYVIYTSGSTGCPKGVEVSHYSICNYLTTAVPDIYRLNPEDRVYQGITLAFDFALEEIWITWMAGATLIAGPTDDRRIGAGLTEFLIAHRITVLCGVPTLLATLEGDLPDVRLMIIGGETCPPELVARWSRPSRRILNTYGPTETTITATWVELYPGCPVTIGRPLPTYSIYILDSQECPTVAGEIGEIWIGGPGVALGYLGAPQLTSQRFMLDPFSKRPGDRRYRTGDLGCWTAGGDIEFHGRMDEQVKLRGFRIDLGEIESVLLEEEAVQGAIVRVYSSPGVGDELAAVITTTTGTDLTDPVLRRRLSERLHHRLPAYMVPAYLDVMLVIPTLASGKVDRKALPAPVIRLDGQECGYIAPATATEKRLAILWTQVLGLNEVSVEADFFLDLGGHSLAAARVTSALRKWKGQEHASIADIYTHRTVRALATYAAAHGASAGDIKSTKATTSLAHASSGHVLATGTVQMVSLALWLALVSAPLTAIIASHHGHTSWTLLWQCVILLPSVYVLGTVLLPVIGVRFLMAGVRPGRYALWGPIYLRWWLSRRLLAISPVRLLSGSPFLPVYLRWLGAHIGRGCYLGGLVIELPHLIRIGDGVSVGAGAVIQAHTVEAGWLTLAQVEIGDGAYVGIRSVVLGGARLGCGSGLGDQSLAHAGMEIPDGEWWAGSPAHRQPQTNAAILLARTAPSPPPYYHLSYLLAYATLTIILELLPLLTLAPPTALVIWTTVTCGVWIGIASLLLAAPFFVILVCVFVAAGVRIASRGITAGVFLLRSGTGVRTWLVSKLMQMSLTLTGPLYSTLYTSPWLRALGARVGPSVEISTLSYVDPVLLTIDEGSFLADLSTVGAATIIEGHLVLSETKVGIRSFVGNLALICAGTCVDDGSLVGVHTLSPDVVPTGSNWLGSPALFLPRRQDSGCFPETLSYHPGRAQIVVRLAIEYMRITLPVTFIGLSVLLAVLGEFALATSNVGVWGLIWLTPVLLGAAGVLVLLLAVALKWLLIGRYRPCSEPLWSLFARRSELVTAAYEGAAVPALLNFLTGTPLMGPALRLFGAQIGPRAWIDTTSVTEFDLLSIGPDATVGTFSALQTHLFEDRVMKMSHVKIGAGATIGSRTVVLYDSHLGEEMVLDSLSLAMKGETFPPHTHWRGIPASRTRFSYNLNHGGKGFNRGDTDTG